MGMIDFNGSRCGELDPFWSADPATAGAAWIRGGFKGHGSKDFFCIDIQDVQDKVGFNRFKKAHSQLWETKVLICFYPDHPVNRCKKYPPSPMPLH